jgi:hypothetical protein
VPEESGEHKIAGHPETLKPKTKGILEGNLSNLSFGHLSVRRNQVI